MKHRCIWTDCEQGSPEWKIARLGIITASKFDDCIPKRKLSAGKSLLKTTETYLLQLVTEDLTGQPQDEIKAKQLEWGKKHEPGARAAYSWATGNGVDQVGFGQHIDHPGIGASSDGLIGDDGCLEIKCPYNPTVHLTNLMSGHVPTAYMPQVQGGMWVLDRQWCDFVSYDPRPKDERLNLSVVRVERDDVYIKTLSEKILELLGHKAALAKKVDEAAAAMWEKLNAA